MTYENLLLNMDPPAPYHKTLISTRTSYYPQRCSTVEQDALKEIFESKKKELYMFPILLTPEIDLSNNDTGKEVVRFYNEFSALNTCFRDVSDDDEPVNDGLIVHDSEEEVFIGDDEEFFVGDDAESENEIAYGVANGVISTGSKRRPKKNVTEEDTTPEQNEKIEKEMQDHSIGVYVDLTEFETLLSDKLEEVDDTRLGLLGSLIGTEIISSVVGEDYKAWLSDNVLSCVIRPVFR
ncbi:uncharacterized protein LOC135848811 isoform X2 [Planococcus citri]|uniref:uncharacterized protein LOC135848811 isoform X2 n=1 Tax=Planococcus citri TaxID=170843 RepID=UPI0031F9DDC8